jgi:hypothetical protein
MRDTGLNLPPIPSDVCVKRLTERERHYAGADGGCHVCGLGPCRDKELRDYRPWEDEATHA